MRSFRGGVKGEGNRAYSSLLRKRSAAQWRAAGEPQSASSGLQ